MHIQMYEVVGTVRENPCNKKSAISHLVIRPAIGGLEIFPLTDLVPLASRNQLEVRIGHFYSVKVEIYFSHNLRKYLARTEADRFLVNNLDNLPVYFQTKIIGGSPQYQQCSL